MRKLLLFIAIFCVAALIPIAYLGWSDISARVYTVIEREPPEIKILLNNAKGIGLAPVTLTIELLDSVSGLDEIVVRTEQKGERREVLRQKLNGEHKQVIHYKFPGVHSKLEEGDAVIEVRAFDKSFWSNAAEESLKLEVDYRKPSVDILTSQHNARRGGSQLVFYKAFDESLVYSGVRVGNRVFEGFRARGIDRDFVDDSLYVAMYAVDLNQQLANVRVSVFAEDAVGNATSQQLVNSIRPRSQATVVQQVSEGALRGPVTELVALNMSIISQLEREISGKEFDFKTTKGSPQRLVEQFQLANERLRPYNADQIVSLIGNEYRYEKYWDGPFLKQPGAEIVRFGDTVEYRFGDTTIGRHLTSGYDIRSAPLGKVIAANAGVVIFSDNLGVYGRMVAIDHGLGVVSLYGSLENVTVSEGDRVEKGQAIGIIGNTGFGLGTHVYFEMRVQGVPVDPLEWWDSAWIGAHIDGKINEVKKLLGITRYIPIE